jgi:tetratricopeptide (TPR) repeat protein
MRRRQWVPLIAVSLSLAFIVFQHSILLGLRNALGFLPPPFDLLAFVAITTFAALVIPLVLIGLSIYYRVFAREAIIRGNEAAKQSNIGKELLTTGEYESAVRACTAALRTNPKLAAAYINRGSAYYHLGQLDEALEDFDRAVQLTPKSANAYAWRGTVWLQAKKLDEALAEFDAALRLEPKNVAYLLQRCGIWHEKSDRGRTLADLDRAVACAPENEVAISSRANFWVLTGNLDRAIADYTQAIRINPASGDHFRSRGLCWHLKGEHEKGIVDLTEAIKLNATDGIAFNNRGACHLKLGDFPAAMRDLNDAIRLEPNHPNAYKNLAWLRATSFDAEFRNGSQAVELATTALRLAGKEPLEWLPIMAAAHAEAGQFTEAEHWQTRFRDACQPSERTEAEARLALYRSGEPFRESASLATNAAAS